MQDFIKKLEELKDFVKSLNASNSPLPKIPGIKPPAPPSLSPKSAKAPKIPGITPESTKDPKKVAEQLKNPNQKTKLEMLKFDKNGQWSLDSK